MPDDTPTKIEMPAPNLSFEQLQEGITQGLYRDFDPAPVGYTIWVDTARGESVEAVAAYIADPPDLDAVPEAIRLLSDAYLTQKACLEAIPIKPPAPAADPWEQLRTDAQARLDSMYNALLAAGGPI